MINDGISAEERKEHIVWIDSQIESLLKARIVMKYQCYDSDKKEFISDDGTPYIMPLADYVIEKYPELSEHLRNCGFIAW